VRAAESGPDAVAISTIFRFANPGHDIEEAIEELQCLVGRIERQTDFRAFQSLLDVILGGGTQTPHSFVTVHMVSLDSSGVHWLPDRAPRDPYPAAPHTGSAVRGRKP
jgi:hypothetical protein